MAKSSSFGGGDNDEKIKDLEAQLSEAKKKKQIEELESEIAALKSKGAKKEPVIMVKGKAVPVGSRKTSKGAKIGIGVAIAFGLFVSCVALVSQSDSEQTEAAGENSAVSTSKENPKVPLEEVLVSPEVLVSTTQCDLATKSIRQAIKKSDKRLLESEGKNVNPRVASEFAKNNAWINAQKLRDELDQNVEKMSSDSLVEVTESKENASLIESASYREVFLTECGLSEDFAKAAEASVKADGRASSIRQLADSVPWYPDGFKEFNENVAIKYAGSCDKGFGYCWTYEVMTLTGCPTSLYLEAAIEQNGANVGFSNDLTSGVKAGQVARMELLHFSGSGTLSARVTEINCY